MEIQSANIESFSMADRIVSANHGPFENKMAQSRGKATAIAAQNRNLRYLLIPLFTYSSFTPTIKSKKQNPKHKQVPVFNFQTIAIIQEHALRH